MIAKLVQQKTDWMRYWRRDEARDRITVHGDWVASFLQFEQCFVRPAGVRRDVYVDLDGFDIAPQPVGSGN